MTRTKFVFSIVLAVAFLAAQVLAVGAAPVAQDAPPVSVVVEEIFLDVDSTTGATTVLVTLNDGQVLRLSVEYATEMGLLNEDGTVNEDAKGSTVELDPDMATPVEPTDMEEEEQHPVGSALSDFFSSLLGVDYETIMEYHEEGAGFGVIAQALWMTNALDGDSETFATILDAKLNNDYSGITLPDGSTPENWGQFRKAVMHDREKAKENLGAIMSGRADNGQGDETQTQTQNNNGNNPDKNKDKENNGKGNDNGNSNKNKDKDKGKKN